MLSKAVVLARWKRAAIFFFYMDQCHLSKPVLELVIKAQGVDVPPADHRANLPKENVLMDGRYEMSPL